MIQGTHGMPTKFWSYVLYQKLVNLREFTLTIVVIIVVSIRLRCCSWSHCSRYFTEFTIKTRVTNATDAFKVHIVRFLLLPV